MSDTTTTVTATAEDILKREQERLIGALGELIEKHGEDGSVAQEKIRAVCNALRKQVDEFESRAISGLEEKFTKEEERLQNALSDLHECKETGDELSKAVQAAEEEVLLIQTYDVASCAPEASIDFARACEVKTKKAITPYYKPRKVEGLTVRNIVDEKLYISFYPKPEDERAFRENGIEHMISYKVSVCKKGGSENGEEFVLEKVDENGDEDGNEDESDDEEYYNEDDDYNDSDEDSDSDSDSDGYYNYGDYYDHDEEEEEKEEDEEENEEIEKESIYSFLVGDLEGEVTYILRVKVLCGNTSESEWSDGIEFTKPMFPGIAWKDQDYFVDEEPTYVLDKVNPRVARVTDFDECAWCTIIANKTLPFNKVITWNVTIRKLKEKAKYVKADGLFVGVAPDDINQSDYCNFRYGWYIDCRDTTLNAGTPHNYDYPKKEYGPEGKKGKNYIRDGSVVGVVVDTAKGELSFILDGVNCGVAYTGILLDKPLVPCAILGSTEYSVELNVSDMKAYKLDDSIPSPYYVSVQSRYWDSITLSWFKVSGASFYQIEVDGGNFLDVSTESTFTKRGLLQDKKHTFRVRAGKGNSLGEWSVVTKGRAYRSPLFKDTTWRECPYDVDEDRKYSVDLYSQRIATRIKYGNAPATVIGDAAIPLNRVISWRIKILKSAEGIEGLFVGVAPSDIDQNNCNNNYEKCGWYYECHGSRLWSGPPHYYVNKYYDERGEFYYNIRSGSMVGVVMDTTKSELSFSFGRKKLGVAYEGIPLDKPLVACVLLTHGGDSVEFIR